MSVQIVITNETYRKGREVFEAQPGIFWTVVEGDELTISEALKRTGAKIAVLGIDPYRNELYRALEKNASGKEALAARFGVGYDSLDLDLCRKHRIILTNTPGALDVSVAEHAISLLLALARNISLLDRQMHNHQYAPITGIELRGRTLGIAGFGNIGKQTALIASRGFGMGISVFDALPLAEQCRLMGISEEEFGARYTVEGYYTDYPVFAASAGIVSIHMPVVESTRGFFDSGRLAALPDGALLINTGRGALIDEDGLYGALVDGKLGGAALDVFENEPYVPVREDRDLRKLDNVVLTPHIASNTMESNRKMAAGVMDNVEAFLEGRFNALARIV